MGGLATIADPEPDERPLFCVHMSGWLNKHGVDHSAAWECVYWLIASALPRVPGNETVDGR